MKAQNRNSIGGDSGNKKRKQQGVAMGTAQQTDWNAVAAALGGMRSASECQDRWRIVEQTRPSQFGHVALGGGNVSPYSFRSNIVADGVIWAIGDWAG